MQGAYQILTPTEGVDFNDYMQRVLASVRRNWYAVMPESAQLGDRGRVVLEFSIRRDGSVPNQDPQQLLGSGKEPLDRAAISAIRSSNPFDHLPPAFSGPEIRLRFIFLYNLPAIASANSLRNQFETAVKIIRQQIAGSPLLAAIVLVIRGWHSLFR